MIAAALLLVAPLAAATDGAEAFCREVAPALAQPAPVGEDALLRWQRVAALFPPEARVVVDSSRALVGDDGAVGGAWAVLRAAADEACAPAAALDEAAARAEVQAILDEDPRFSGTRGDEDAVDRLQERVWAFIVSLLESRAMQQYAGSARFLYLTALALGVFFVLARLVREARRRRAVDEQPQAETGAVLQERKRAFAEWRALADARLSQGDARGALRAGRMALLARVGEVDVDAVTPARTHREILSRLHAARRAVVEQPLSVFDRAFYGGQDSAEGAARFLALVDEAERGLQGAP